MRSGIIRRISAAAAAGALIALSGCTPFIVKNIDSETVRVSSPDTPDKPIADTDAASSSKTEQNSRQTESSGSQKENSSKGSDKKQASSASKAEAKKAPSSSQTGSEAKKTSSASQSSDGSQKTDLASQTVSEAASTAASSEIEETQEQQSEASEAEPRPKAESIALSVQSSEVTVGSTFTPIITFLPENAEPAQVVFTVSDADILSINGDGSITALNEGSSTLSAMLSDNKASAQEITITVTPKPEPLPTENCYIDGILIVNKTYSMTEDMDPGGLTPECAAAFDELVNAAAQAGYSLYSNSDYRSYADQQALYNSYVWSYGQATADSLCSIPGHSEHQTGLAIDVASYRTGYFPGTPEAQWLADNCAAYGFIIRYPYGKEWATGYSYEAWHIRYVGDKAREITDSGLSLEEYLGV